MNNEQNLILQKIIESYQNKILDILIDAKNKGNSNEKIKVVLSEYMYGELSGIRSVWNKNKNSPISEQETVEVVEEFLLLVYQQI